MPKDSSCAYKGLMITSALQSHRDWTLEKEITPSLVQRGLIDRFLNRLNIAWQLSGTWFKTFEWSQEAGGDGGRGEGDSPTKAGDIEGEQSSCSCGRTSHMWILGWGDAMLGELGGLPNPRLRGQPELGFILHAIFLTPWLRLEALVYARTQL